MRRFIISWFRNVGLLIFFAILITILIIGFFQDRFIFRPEKLHPDFSYSLPYRFTEHFIATSDGETLNMLSISPPDSTRGLLIYFHGNAGNLSRWGQIAGKLAQYGYHVLVVDYRGYGKSTGRPTEKGLYTDADAVLNWAQQNFDLPIRIIYGRSLGAAVAARAALKAQPDLLILETPFDELKGAVRPSLQFFMKIVPLKYSFPTAKYLTSISCRVLIGHGTEDEIVSPASALRIKPLLKPTDTFVLVNGGNHNNLGHFAEWNKAVEEALRSLPFVKTASMP